MILVLVVFVLFVRPLTASGAFTKSHKSRLIDSISERPYGTGGEGTAGPACTIARLW